MSNFEALGLLMAWGLFSTYILVVILRAALSIFGMVQTGLLDGLPVSIEFRRRLVWSWSFPVNMCAIILNSFGTLLLIQLGMNVDDPKLQNLAYLYASVTGLTAIGWAMGTATTMIYQLALLRKEKS